MKTILLFGSIALLALTTVDRGTELPPRKVVKEGTIVNLYDAFGKDPSLTKDFGFSCITQWRGMTILFDAGSNADIFRENTTKLGIDLTQVDIAIVSHAHFDHLNGIDYLLQVNPRVKIYFPYDIYWGAPVPFDATGSEPSVADSLPAHMRYFDGGSTKFSINQSGRFWKANIEFVKASKEILPGLTLIATSSEQMGYFSCYPGKSFVEGQVEHEGPECRNTNLPELSLSMETDRGQVLIVGCSHTGVENIIKQSVEVTGGKTELVYGGFHLLPFDRMQTAALTKLLKDDLKVHRVAPAHCTGHLAFKLLSEAYGKDYLYAGLGETIKF